MAHFNLEAMRLTLGKRIVKRLLDDGFFRTLFSGQRILDAVVLVLEAWSPGEQEVTEEFLQEACYQLEVRSRLKLMVPTLEAL